MSIKNIISKLNNAVKQKKTVVHIFCGINISRIVLQFLTILENQGFIES
jgi:ribosomal protein S8